MEWFIAVVVVAALGVAAIVAAGGLGSMPTDPTRDVFRQDLPTDRDLTGEDLRRLRFGVAVRGYAMNQVDDVLDRLSGELAERDRRIADLEARLAGDPAPTSAPLSTAGVGFTPEDGRSSTSTTEQPERVLDSGEPSDSGPTIEYLR